MFPYQVNINSVGKKPPKNKWVHVPSPACVLDIMPLNYFYSVGQCFVLFFHSMYCVLGFLFSPVSPSLSKRNPDPGTLGRPFSPPPPTTVRAFIFCREKTSAIYSLVDWHPQVSRYIVTGIYLVHIRTPCFCLPMRMHRAPQGAFFDHEQRSP